jgi:hypothetical protein
MGFEYKLSEEEYEALIESDCRGATNEEYDAFIEDLKHHAMNGDILSTIEMHHLWEALYDDVVEEEYLEVGRHGWVEYQEIVELDGRYFSFYRLYNDMCGTDFEQQKLIEVVAKEVKVKKWVIKDSD